MDRPGSGRPWTVRALAVIYLATALYWASFVSEWRATSLGWVAGLAGLYLIWQGSRAGMVAAGVVLAAFLVVALVAVEMAMEPGGHHPAIHVVEAALLLAMIALLAAPATRRYCTRALTIFQNF
ncbi:MAG TPA: hypothetical protein VG318_01600 [Actinomycetota bacterium]|nr:hypothetical protein [Actinomycetota bacterium]